MSLGDRPIVFQSSPPSSSSGHRRGLRPNSPPPAPPSAGRTVPRWDFRRPWAHRPARRTAVPGVEQRLVPAAGGCAYRHQRCFERRKSAMIVERMEQADMQCPARSATAQRHQARTTPAGAPARPASPAGRKPPPSGPASRNAVRADRRPPRQAPHRRCPRSADGRTASRRTSPRPAACSAVAAAPEADVGAFLRPFIEQPAPPPPPARSTARRDAPGSS